MIENNLEKRVSLESSALKIPVFFLVMLGQPQHLQPEEHAPTMCIRCKVLLQPFTNVMVPGTCSAFQLSTLLCCGT